MSNINLNPDILYSNDCYCESCNTKMIETECCGEPAWVCPKCNTIIIDCETDELESLHYEWINTYNKLKNIESEILKRIKVNKNNCIEIRSNKISGSIVINNKNGKNNIYKW